MAGKKGMKTGNYKRNKITHKSEVYLGYRYTPQEKEVMEINIEVLKTLGFNTSEALKNIIFLGGIQMKSLIMILKNRIEQNGFIDNSDNTERYLDELANDLAQDENGVNETVAEGLLEVLKAYLDDTYRKIEGFNKQGDYIGFWVSSDVPEDVRTIEDAEEYFKWGE